MREVSGDSLKIKSDTFSEMGKVSAETRKSIMEAKGKNMSIKDICKNHNLSKATVHRVLAGGPATSAVEGKSSGRSAPPTLFEATTIELSNILDDKPTNEMIQEEEKKQTKHTAQSLENLSEHLMDMPLENENEIIEKLSNGELAFQITTNELQKDEFNLMIKNFQKMKDQLTQSIQKIRKSTHRHRDVFSEAWCSTPGMQKKNTGGRKYGTTRDKSMDR